MWSNALFNLRVRHKLFWKLTPRQYDLLVQRHREALTHREMVAAFTTSAVVNHSFSPPDKPVPPSHWMPHFEPPRVSVATPATPKQMEAKAEFDGKAAQLTAEMKAYSETGAVGPMLRGMAYGEKEIHADELG